ERRVAVAADRDEEAPFCRDSGRRGAVLERREQRPRAGVVGPALEGEGPLPHRRNELVGWEWRCVWQRKSQSREARGSENDRVHVALAPLPEPRVDVAPQLPDLEVGPAREELGAPANARRPDASAGGQRGEAPEATRDQDVVGRGALRHGAED